MDNRTCSNCKHWLYYLGVMVCSKGTPPTGCSKDWPETRPRDYCNEFESSKIGDKFRGKVQDTNRYK